MADPVGLRLGHRAETLFERISPSHACLQQQAICRIHFASAPKKISNRLGIPSSERRVPPVDVDVMSDSGLKLPVAMKYENKKNACRDGRRIQIALRLRGTGGCSRKSATALSQTSRERGQAMNRPAAANSPAPAKKTAVALRAANTP